MYWNNLKKEEYIVEKYYFSKNSRLWEVLSILFILILFSGCITTQIPDVEIINIDKFPAYKMPDGSKIYPASIDETVPDIDILAINDEIKNFLNKEVMNIRNPRNRLEKLSKILVEKIEYDTLNDAYGTKTAQETFETGIGNCLSFSNLFIAITRYAGFRSKFSEIPTLPNWARDGEVLFITRHIGASIDLIDSSVDLYQLEFSDDGNRVMTMNNSLRFYFTPSELTNRNFNLNPFGVDISDNRAFAQYYNNLGSKYIAQGNTPEAFRYFIKAIKTYPSLSFAWSNLGVIYRQNNQLDAAETAYLQGLAVTQGSRDTSVLTIMNNLANLYEISGKKEKAEFYKGKVASFREKNPYYQYVAGKTAYDESDFKKSVGLFRRAIRLKDDEHLFYYGLALAYLETGEIKKAKLNINRAIKYSWTERRKTYYEKILGKIKDIN